MDIVNLQLGWGLRPADAASVIKPVHGHAGYAEGMDSHRGVPRRSVQEYDVIA